MFRGQHQPGVQQDECPVNRRDGEAEWEGDEEG